MSKSLEHSLIITSYHRDEGMANLTRKCLASLKERPDEVIVVDDCSPLRVEFPNVKQIFRKKNGGFPECANTGFREAKGDIIILSNNDVEYTDGWLEAILEPLKMGYDISSIRVSDSDGETTENKITEGDFFGSLWAMKREVYDTIGGFDERFKDGTFEDKDFHLRAEAAGFKIAKNHAAYVKHTGRATMVKVYPNNENYKTNMERFKKKWGYVL